jgi:hypothetical protein
MSLGPIVLEEKRDPDWSTAAHLIQRYKLSVAGCEG